MSEVDHTLSYEVFTEYFGFGPTAGGVAEHAQRELMTLRTLLAKFEKYAGPLTRVTYEQGNAAGREGHYNGGMFMDMRYVHEVRRAYNEVLARRQKETESALETR